jgi:hypothetical protein
MSRRLEVHDHSFVVQIWCVSAEKVADRKLGQVRIHSSVGSGYPSLRLAL